MHREDGPAIEHADGSREFWYNGEELRVRTLSGLKKAIKLFIIQEVQQS
jgi:hypothetical protein